MGRHGVAETLTGALVLVVALAFLAYGVAHSGRSVRSGYMLYGQFDNIAGLSVGGDVRLAGVKVGTVTEERLDPKSFEAIVSMTVQDDVRLPKDTVATITSESLLGGKYVSLVPGGDETELKPGQRITITQSSVNLEELLGKFIFSVTSLNDSKDGQSGGGKSGGVPNPGDQAPVSQRPGGGSGGLAPLPK
jgi:phospholipid/cholesterol/gamma-HCH transport system substrate-binding protein